MANIDLSCGRRAPRKHVDLPCAVTPKNGRTRRLRLTELSPLGGWIRTSKPLPEGTLLSLRFSLPDGTPLQLRAEVMWNETRRRGRGAGMGVELLGLTSEQAGWIGEATVDCEIASGGESRFSFADRMAC